jgi:hypothetical protein
LRIGRSGKYIEAVYVEREVRPTLEPQRATCPNGLSNKPPKENMTCPLNQEDIDRR